MSLLTFSVVAGVLASLLQLTRAWFDNGHMLTAEIARQQLTPNEVAVLNDVLSDWSGDFPGMSDLVTSSVWPDLIKCTEVSPFCKKDPVDSIEIFSDWHFDDRPYNPEQLPLSTSQVASWGNDPSATWALTNAMGTFGNSHTRFAFNLLLRFAIHLVGDLHQPLHAIEGFFNDKRFGNLAGGDHGGNLIRVEDTCGAGSLHFYWDAGACNYVTHWAPHYNRAPLEANATALIAKYPKDAPVFAGRYDGPDSLAACWTAVSGQQEVRDHGFALCDAAFLAWANDTYTIASNNVYRGIESNSVVSPEYEMRAFEISQQQLVLGGYRLSDLLRLVAARANAVLPPLALASRPRDEVWTATEKVLLCATIFFATFSAALLFPLVLAYRRSSMTRFSSAQGMSLIEASS